MSWIYQKTLVLVGVVAMLGVGGIASAQNTASNQAYTETPMVNQLRANIPFNFEIGDNSIQAGTYELDPVTPANTTQWQIKDSHGNVLDTFNVNAVTTTKTPKKDVLVFGEQGNQEHLAQIWLRGNDSGWQLVQAPPQAQMTNMRHVTAQDGGTGSWGSSHSGQANQQKKGW